MLHTYRELMAWQRSIDLVAEIYRVTETFPKSELYGIVSQMRRAAVSIPANIAEGYARKHRQEHCQFVRIAFGSGAELETHVTVAERLQLATPSALQKSKQLLDEVM